MITVLDLDFHLKMTILRKQTAKSFSRLFRSSKALKIFIEENKGKFSIKLDGGLHIIRENGSNELNVTCKRGRPKRKRIYTLQGDALDTVRYFQFSYVECIPSTCREIYVSKGIQMCAESLIALWDKEVNELMRYMKPSKGLLLFSDGVGDVVELDMEIYGSLELEQVGYNILWNNKIEKQRAQFLVSKCSSLTASLQISLTVGAKFNFKKEVINLIKTWKNDNSEKCRRLTIVRRDDGVPSFPQNIGDTIDALFHDVESDEKMKLWTIPKKNGGLMCVEDDLNDDKFQLQLICAPNLEALKAFADAHDDGDLDYDIMWEAAMRHQQEGQEE